MQSPKTKTDRLLPRRELRSFVPVSDMTIWRWETGWTLPAAFVDQRPKLLASQRTLGLDGSATKIRRSPRTRSVANEH